MPNFFCFHSDWPEDVDDKIEFIIKYNESLAENKIKNKIEQLLLKYKYRNNVHESRKKQNESTT